jgi:valyl-tRNA synthetase
MDKERQSLQKTYDPGPVESKWYEEWEKRGLFNADVNKSKKPFSIVIPPPNVTGSLHIGHAFNHTFQDIICRYKRMQGYIVLWLPGTDHAGIATQNVVERKLAEDGISRQELGREEFVKKVWEWKEDYGDRIINQQKKLGDSCDWRRLRFTMDEGLSRAVRTVFVRLYEKGLVYRGKYLINWCPRCHTALSDLEVEHEEEPSKLYYVKYPVVGEDTTLTVATTRPETILGDTAIAIHPRSEDKKHLIGKKVKVPGTERTIPVIEDIMVDPGFGTGCVKITPAHDPNDFLVGQRHDLEQIAVIDENGIMNENASVYKGMTVKEARERIVEDLSSDGLVEKTEDIQHSVGHCYRCNTVIEPYLSEQWFVKTRPLADAGVRAVKEGKISWVPKQWENTYFQWMENIRDWCISRQLWWGHRIPAWTCQDCGHLTVAETDPDVCESCGSANILQDEDVLDTWFSSALWPFSTLGWPDKTEDLDYFYPTSLMVTGFDIIFFWVARMIMMGLEFMDEEPFKDVYIHALVRDENGQKMSKSKGNVIDPLTLIDEFGADSLRLTIAALTVQGRDILLGRKKVETYRLFMNKMWNASRFALMNLSDEDREHVPADQDLRLHDKWIISRTEEVVKTVTEYMEGYYVGEAARLLYDFVWSELCDWYLELSKPALRGEETPARKKATQVVMRKVFRQVIIMLHPFVPFITEELWNAFDFSDGLIEEDKWPEGQESTDPSTAIYEDFSNMQEIIGRTRNLRAEAGLPPQKRIEMVHLRTEKQGIINLIKDNQDLISLLTGVDNISFLSEGENKPSACLVAVLPDLEIYLGVGSLVDVDQEISRLEEELSAIEKNILKSESKLKNEKFVNKAPDEIVQKEKDRLKESNMRKDRILQNIQSLRGE